MNYTTVFLLHGIGQTSGAMLPFWSNLTASNGPPMGLDLSRFVVDYGFDFGECTNSASCGNSKYGVACGVSAGGQSLARYIASKNPPGGIVLIGYSLGGLIARDLLVNSSKDAYKVNNVDVLVINPVQGLITLGTPNWGYPYLGADAVIFCPQLLYDMAGSWNPDTNRPNQTLSSFLPSLIQAWSTSSYGGYWLAAAGTYCSSSPYRRPTNVIGQSTGCLTSNLYSDGVVCMDSAQYSGSTPVGTPSFPGGGPTILWSDPGYVHTKTLWGWGTSFVFCGASLNARTLFNPPAQESLYNQIVQVLNGH